MVLTDRESPVSFPDPSATAIAALHSDVDREAYRLHVLHAPRLQCRLGCSSCCVDGLSVFDAEADHIRLHHAELLARANPHAEGACAFLDERDACRIYPDRPYVCRTQGLPLRWIEGEDEGEDDGDRDAVELRDICPLNEAGEPIENLATEDCWTIGPTEQRLAELQVGGGGSVRRTLLRDLFEKPKR